MAAKKTKLTADQRAALEVLSQPLKNLSKEVERLLAAKSDASVTHAKLRALIVALEKPLVLTWEATSEPESDYSKLEEELEAARIRIAELEKLDKHLEEIKDSIGKSEDAWSKGIRDFTAGADLLLGRVATSNLGRSAPRGWQGVAYAWQPVRYVDQPDHPSLGGGGTVGWQCYDPTLGGGGTEGWQCYDPTLGGGGTVGWQCYDPTLGGGGTQPWRCRPKG